MPRNRNEEYLIENAEIVFKNFSGAETAYKPAGYRSFSIILTDKQAHELSEKGWNVRTLKANPENEDSVDRPIIEVALGYKGRAPRVVMITSSRTDLDEDTVGILDDMEFLECDVVIRPYDWSVRGQEGRKAYLSRLFVEVYQDPTDLKWANRGRNARE